MHKILIVLTVIYIAFAAVQYNDPDPYFWIFLYAFIALLCILRIFTNRLSVVTSLGIVAYSIIFIWRVSTMFELSQRDAYSMEELKEAGGLLLSCATLIFLHLSCRYKRTSIGYDGND
ncbi:MAG: transmembrane 220 family protein [Spirochaetota bacterium]